jgi:hypothetical protein
VHLKSTAGGGLHALLFAGAAGMLLVMPSVLAAYRFHLEPHAGAPRMPGVERPLWDRRLALAWTCDLRVAVCRRVLVQIFRVGSLELYLAAGMLSSRVRCRHRILCVRTTRIFRDPDAAFHGGVFLVINGRLRLLAGRVGLVPLSGIVYLPRSPSWELNCSRRVHLNI